MRPIDITVPDGKEGDWSVETFVVSEEEARLHNLRETMKGGRRIIDPGAYKRLKRGTKTIMSNTQAECWDFRHFVRRAFGLVLINGLGLGVVLRALLDNGNVTEVTVIEKSEDVIKLVAPAFVNDKRVTILHGDAFTWKPPKNKRYDFVWHDIWDDICTDNLKEMGKLHRKYGRRAGYQDSWSRDLCLYFRERGR